MDSADSLYGVLIACGLCLYICIGELIEIFRESRKQKLIEDIKREGGYRGQ